jgi:hypothetical protein
MLTLITYKEQLVLVLIVRVVDRHQRSQADPRSYVASSA